MNYQCGQCCVCRGLLYNSSCGHTGPCSDCRADSRTGGSGGDGSPGPTPQDNRQEIKLLTQELLKTLQIIAADIQAMKADVRDLKADVEQLCRNTSGCQ